MRPLPDGGTERDALRLYKKHQGRDHPDAVSPVEIPTSIAYLWDWFWQLCTGRPIGGMGTLLPIPPTEIEAWARLRGVELQDWELETIWALDTAYRAAMQPA